MTRRSVWARCASAVAATTAAAALVQCGNDEPGATLSTSSTDSRAVSSAPPAQPSSPRSVTPTEPPATAASPEPEQLAARVVTVDAVELGATWRDECPVDPRELRRINLAHLGFDGEIHRGDLVVHQDLVDDVIEVFAELLRLGYPIEKMQTVDRYAGADDELSMSDNNTSAFNCRLLPSGTGWSLHAYGRAIDVNPLLNPYIDSTGAYQPANAGPYLDRSRTEPGMLHEGDPAVAAFLSRGWRWGGDWRTPIDYQHFEKR